MKQIDINLKTSQTVFVANDFNAIRNKIKGRAVIVTEKRVFSKWGAQLAEELYISSVDYVVLYVPEGESKKSFSVLNYIANKMVENNIGINDNLIAFGGGTVCNLCAVLASLYMQGINLTLVPTTIIASIDASIGGNGFLHLDKSINGLGVNYLAKTVLVNTKVLESLSEKEVNSGIALQIKYGLIADSSIISLLKQSKQIALTQPFIEKCIEIKKNIIEKSAENYKILNFGNTIGQALQIASNFSISYGESLLMGMVYANFITTTLVAGKSVASVDALNTCLTDLGLTMPKRPAIEKVLKALDNNKTINNGKIEFISVEEIGKANIVSLKVESVKEVLKKIWTL